jgi:hypothetical protein
VRVLKEPSAQVKTEFERIGHNQVVREFLETSLENAKTVLVNTTDDHEFRTVQGQAQAISHILDAMKPGKR